MQTRRQTPPPGGTVVLGNVVEVGVGLMLVAGEAGIELKPLQTVWQRNINADSLRSNPLRNRSGCGASEKVVVGHNIQAATQLDDVIHLRKSCRRKHH